MRPAAARTLLDALDEPALIVSGERVAAANAAARRLLGARIEGSDVRLAIRQPAALVTILKGEPADLDVTGIGTAERPWTVTVRPIGDQGVLVRLADRSAARAAERMRVDFVANASHELRTPLTTILGYADTIADGDCEGEAAGRFGGIIASEARRMLRIVEDLMSLSRIEADRFNPPLERVDPNELAEVCAANARELADRRRCAILVDATAGHAIRGDFGQLLQMLDNVLANAIRYGCTAPGAVVRMAVADDGRDCLFTISDEGEGIAPEHLPRLTERFYRVDAARSRDSGGTGLGLAIVKHIVERHRGTLAIRSERGRGTQVTIRIPGA